MNDYRRRIYEALPRQPAPDSLIGMAAARVSSFEIDIMTIHSSLFVRGATPYSAFKATRLRVQRIKALRSCLKRMSRFEFLMLVVFFQPVGNATYRMDLWPRKNSEKPSDAVDTERQLAREVRDYATARRMYELMDEGMLQDAAIGKALNEIGSPVSVGSFKQYLKYYWPKWRERGFTNPTAILFEVLMGTRRLEDVTDQPLSIDRRSSKGRKVNKK